MLLTGGEELVDRELEVIENIARILLFATATCRAITFRQADVICRHKKLDVAFEADDGELTDGDVQTTHIFAQNDICTEQLTNAIRHFRDLTAAAALETRLYDLRVENDRVDNFDYGSRLVAALLKLNVGTTAHIARGENARAAFTAEQDDALVGDCKTFQNLRTTDGAARLYRDTIEESDINTVEASIRWLPMFQCLG